MLMIALSTAAADSPSSQPPPAPPPSTPSAPDMALLEFLGSVETDSNAGEDILTEIDTALIPELPETPRHEDR